TRPGVTVVTKVVAVTSFVKSFAMTSSSNPSDQGGGSDIITKVVRVKPTAVNTAHCNPLLCSLNVAVHEILPLPRLKKVLNLGSVGLGILLASGVRKYSEFLHNFQYTISGTSSRIGPVSSSLDYS
ncbi:MAG: hypothetical protein Q9175_006967, partial [Cornicularia normoerica]